MDYERVKFFAQTIIDGVPRAELEAMHYLKDAEDDQAYMEAKRDPEAYAFEELDPEVCGACPPPPMLVDFLRSEGVWLK